MYVVYLKSLCNIKKKKLFLHNVELPAFFFNGTFCHLNWSRDLVVSMRGNNCKALHLNKYVALGLKRLLRETNLHSFISAAPHTVKSN